MLVPVIMAGGVGSRLWPVSRESYPKQFISFQPDAGSLFQETLTRLEGLQGLSPPVIVCNQEHRFLVAEQLRQIDVSGAAILLEPVGRNTAPAVALAAMQALEVEPDAIMLVLAADHIIRDVGVFHGAVREGEKQARSGKLVSFGIVPQGPETGYGYIRRGQANGQVYEIDRFVEKPDLETARAYLDSRAYYWNSGMFMFSAARYLLELGRWRPDILQACEKAYQQSVRDLDFKRISETEFAACPADSIDYAVMERTEDGVVVPLDAGWNDLGAWSSLWDSGVQDARGNVCYGDTMVHEVSNSFVQAESRLVCLVGMNDAVVIETRDAVLVAAKDQVQQVKEIVSRLKEASRLEADSHTLVHRPWGSYETLAVSDGFQVKRIIVKPAASLSLQLHHYRAEHWVVVKGTARVTRGEEVFTLQENESTYIPVETRHRLENPGTRDVVLIEVQCGSYLGEDDIVRFDDNYGRQDASETTL
ncbi:MAG: mannose-1-phosphate guanylyltransferase/mannose-6-phosphate isomerase [Pseudohongiellaceae bacterium]